MFPCLGWGPQLLYFINSVMSVEPVFVYQRRHCQSGANQNRFYYYYYYYYYYYCCYCFVKLVKVVPYCLSSEVDLPITYHFLVITSLLLLFHYFRTNFASTWKNDTIKCIIKMTISTWRTLRMILLTHSSKPLSSMNQETRYNVEFLNWGPILLRCNSARIDLFMSEKSCWSQAQMKEEGIKGMRLIMDRSNETKKMQIWGKQWKIDKKKTKIKMIRKHKNRKKQRNKNKKKKGKEWKKNIKQKDQKKKKMKHVTKQTWSRNYQSGKTKTRGGSDPFFS